MCFLFGFSGFDLKIGYGKNYYLGSICISVVNGSSEFIELVKKYEVKVDDKVKNNIMKIKEIW